MGSNTMETNLNVEVLSVSSEGLSEITVPLFVCYTVHRSEDVFSFYSTRIFP